MTQGRLRHAFGNLILWNVFRDGVVPRIDVAVLNGNLNQQGDDRLRGGKAVADGRRIMVVPIFFEDHRVLFQYDEALGIIGFQRGSCFRRKLKRIRPLWQGHRVEDRHLALVEMAAVVDVGTLVSIEVGALYPANEVAVGRILQG